MSDYQNVTFVSNAKVITNTYIDELRPLNNSYLMAIGDRIRARRLELGISQLGFADLIETRHQTVWRYEKNKIVPSAKALDKISKVLKVSHEWLLHGQELEPVAEKISYKRSSELKSWLITMAPDDLTHKEQEILSSINFLDMHPGPQVYTIILTTIRMAHPVGEATSRITNIKAG